MKTEEIFASTVVMPLRTGSENCLPLNTRLSDFQITGILGEGGFGIVYLAFDHSLQRTVAIKEYMPGSLAGRGEDASVTLRSDRHQDTFNAGLKSFINEARLLAQFDHPSLVKVYRFWEQNKTAYMAMRYYDGYTLKDIINQNPETVTEPWLKFIFKQILEALETLYRMKVLHRDISPDNIIVQKNGDAVLLDFGSARQIIGDMTKGLTVILKPGFAPIEQYSDDASMEQGAWTDIYALAAVLYFAVTKRAPPNSIARIIKDPLEPLSIEKYGDFDQEFLAAIDQGLVVQPEGRPQNIDEFRKLLGIAPSGRGGRNSNSVQSKALVGAREIADEANITTQKTEMRSPVPRTELRPEAKTEIQPEVRSEAPTETETRAPVMPEAWVETAPAAPSLMQETLPMLVPERLPDIVTDSRSDGNKDKLNKKSKNSKDAKTKSPAKTWQLGLAGVLLVAGAVGAYFAMSGGKTDEAIVASASASASASISANLGLDQEAADWEKLKSDPAVNSEQINAFLQKYPNGKFFIPANEKLAELQTKAPSASAAASVASDAASAATDASMQASASAAASAVSGVLASASADASKPVELATTYKLVVKPWGTVFVDDQEAGVSPPLKKLVLTEGKHKIRIVNPTFPDYLIEIQVGKKKFGTIEHDFAAKK